MGGSYVFAFKVEVVVPFVSKILRSGFGLRAPDTVFDRVTRARSPETVPFFGHSETMHLITRQFANVDKLDNSCRVARPLVRGPVSVRPREKPRSDSRARLFFFFTLYYQNTKVEGKNCQLSLHLVAGKWCGMRITLLW
jgi:hypothetical protein